MIFCKQCGTQYDEKKAACCPNCGTPVVTSTWDGGVLETIGASIVASLITAITCGIATPWAVCYMMRFIIGHTVIDGARLTFVGKGGSLFGKWLLWALLTVVTCGIYSFWVVPKMYKWIASNVHVAQ